MKTYTRLKQMGQKVYVEMYDAGDYNSSWLFGFISDTAERAFHNESLVWAGKLLQARRASYLPGRTHGSGETLVSIEDCLGSHEAVIPGKYCFPAVTQSGPFRCAAVRISRVDRLTMLPHAQWCALYGEIFAPLLGVTKEKTAEGFPEGLAGHTAGGRRKYR